MEIVMITDLYPVCENEKNTPRTLWDFVESWRNSGHRVSVIKPNFILNSFVRKKPFYKSGEYEDVLNLNFWLPFMGNFSRYKKSDDAIYIAHMPSGILFADRMGVPFVAGIHQSDIDVLTKPLYKFYFGKRLLKALRNSRAIACRSFVLKKKLLGLYPEFESKTFVCPSGIDEEKIIQKEFKPLSEKIKVLTVARFKKRKNIDKVIEAVKSLESFELTVVGDGENKKYLENLASNCKKITFTGTLSNDEVLEKMRSSDIFILPSVNETFGMVYLEAMASGCVTVGTIDDGVDGIIKNGENGFLIKSETDEIKNILNYIKNADEDSLKALHEKSFSTICNYTKQKCCEEYLQQILRFCKDLTTS
ncbi:glycosyltransferase [bacterium]|nr:glycosyltransferase [bacterium]